MTLEVYDSMNYEEHNDPACLSSIGLDFLGWLQSTSHGPESLWFVPLAKGKSDSVVHTAASKIACSSHLSLIPGWNLSLSLSPRWAFNKELKGSGAFKEWWLRFKTVGGQTVHRKRQYTLLELGESENSVVKRVQKYITFSSVFQQIMLLSESC